jgi:hypothetical protein
VLITGGAGEAPTRHIHEEVRARQESLLSVSGLKKLQEKEKKEKMREEKMRKEKELKAARLKKQKEEEKRILVFYVKILSVRNIKRDLIRLSET